MWQKGKKQMDKIDKILIGAVIACFIMIAAIDFILSDPHAAMGFGMAAFWAAMYFWERA